MKIIFLSFLFIFFSHHSDSQSLGADRISKLKSSVVRVFVEKQASGTGFFVTQDGWLLTCWHVIEPALIRDSSHRIIGLKKMYIQFSNGEKVEVGIMTDLLGKGYQNGISYDYALLKIQTTPITKFSPLKIGRFEDIQEGDEIYTCGYPLGIEQQFISKGILSTKWDDKETLKGGAGGESVINREVAWLDLTMNRGNSGGPIIKLGSTPNNDEVIGLADFILNPFANAADELINYLNENANKGSILIQGVDFGKMALLFGSAIAYNSIGVSGCISIDYPRTLLIGENH
ncbi:MAG: trypsin-like peptidase domain-containing protein [Bacteroidota bacterium]|nr:trypsin-like peptidase domain-containing protein [Bacteroidota bacterium]